jgi:hypothetical protein
MGTGDTYNLNPATPFKLQMSVVVLLAVLLKNEQPLALKNQNQANVPFAWF